MKRWWNTLILLLGGGVILAVWYLLPQQLVERQDAFCSRVAVAIENVHPYGEEAANVRKKLERAIRTEEDMRYEIIDPRSKEEYRAFVKETALHFQDFLDQCNDRLVPYFQEKGITLEDCMQLCMTRESDTCELVQIIYAMESEDYTNWALGFFLEPTTGIPVRGSILVDMENFGMVGEELFKELMEAYSSSLGIPFYEIIWWDSGEKGKTYSYDSDASAEISVSSDVIDINRVYQAESVDGSYRLTVSFEWISADELTLDFELQVHNGS